MRTFFRLFQFGLVIALIGLIGPSSFAGSARSGIRGKTMIYQAGFATETSPGVWVGVGGIFYPAARSLTVLTARTGEKVTQVVSDANGQFQVSLKPGKYLLVPDESFGMKSQSGTIAATVRALRMTEVTMVWEPVPVSESSVISIQPIIVLTR